MSPFKTWVGLTTTVGFLCGTLGAANADTFASSSFIPAGPDDVGAIDHVNGRYVTNNDTASPRNALLDLGTMVVAPGATWFYHIRASQEGSTTSNLTCWVIVTLRDTLTELASPSVEWAPGESGSKVISYTYTSPSSEQKPCTATLFCAIPAKRSSGSRIYNAWF